MHDQYPIVNPSLLLESLPGRVIHDNNLMHSPPLQRDSLGTGLGGCLTHILQEYLEQKELRPLYRPETDW